MCNAPKAPKSSQPFVPAPVEAVRALASPFDGARPPGMDSLRIPQPAAPSAASASGLTIPTKGTAG